eukprot:4990798-Amphidinium_carterae.2
MGVEEHWGVSQRILHQLQGREVGDHRLRPKGFSSLQRGDHVEAHAHRSMDAKCDSDTHLAF